jgi:hypothetical protein
MDRRASEPRQALPTHPDGSRERPIDIVTVVDDLLDAPR